MNTYQKGDVAELVVAADLAKRGYQVAFPFSTSSDWDLLLIRDKEFERIQVKSRALDDKGVLLVPNRVMSNTAGGQSTRLYTADDVDWIAVYCPDVDDCFYIPISLVEGRETLYLRFEAPKNNQTKGINWAKDFTDI